METVTARGLGVVLAAALACDGPSSTSGAAAESGGSPDAAAGAAAETAPGNPERGDWLVLHALSDPESLNPLTQTDASARRVLRWIQPTLLQFDPETLEQRPWLAQELPEISEDKLRYRFRLREGVTFADGEPFTSDDVLFTIKALKNPFVRAPSLRNYFESLEAVEVKGPFEIEFAMSKPYFRNHIMLGGLRGLPRHYYDPDDLMGDITVAELADPDAMEPEKRERAEAFAKQFNEDYNRRPMGAGAFELRDPENDIVTGERIVLHHRDDFWAPGDVELGDAWVDRIVFRVINDQEAALASFKRQDLDRVGLTPVQYQRPDTKSASFEERAHKRERLVSSYVYIGWNSKRPMFSDAATRRALGHFVDKQGLLENVLFGLGESVEGPISRDRSEYNDALEPFPFDPERGAALLAEAGWSDSDGDGTLDREIDGERVPLRFELITNSGNQRRKLTGLAVVDQLKRAGIDATLREIDWSIMLGKVDQFDFDAVVLAWTMQLTEPDLYQIWHSSQAIPGGSNFVSFKNAEVDQMLEAYRQEFDPAERKRMIDRIQEILYEEQPYTWLFSPKAVDSWDRRFQGVTWYEKAKDTDMSEWWVPEGDQRYVQ